MVFSDDIKSFSGSTLRVATLNCAGANPNAEERFLQIADHIAQIDADVVCLQEIFPSQLSYVDSGFASVFGFFRPDQMGLVVLSKFDVVDSFSQLLPGPHVPHNAGYVPDVVGVDLDVSGTRFSVLTAHLAWGSGAGALVRLQQVAVIEQLVAARYPSDEFYNPANPVVFCGDFNMLDTEVGYRFLTGGAVVDGRVGDWVDVAKVLGSSQPTTGFSNINVVHAATIVGVSDVSLLPDRRIDYVMCRGFRYGKVGAPVAAGRFADTCPVPSDHFGVYADFWVP